MSRLTIKQIEEANEATMQRFRTGQMNADCVTSEGIIISIEHFGKTYTHLLTWEDIRAAYRKALEGNVAAV